MLTKEQNEQLTRVGPGTLMGDLLRQYWIPFYRSADLESGGQPARVRLLGEDLVVYRDPGHAPGVVREQCAHRGASLFFGRNEPGGLRCIYHGWKFDAGGRCLEMPNEPAESDFKSKVRQPAYPCVERNGIIWTYMGPTRPAPPLPQLEWNVVPASQSYLPPLRVQEVNFVQALEGEYDSSHAAILHAGLSSDFGDADRASRPAPRFYTSDTDYGVLIAARYPKPGSSADYWRIYPFMMPFHTIVNVNPTYQGPVLFSGHVWIPMDDEHSVALGFTWHPNRDLTAEERVALAAGAPDGLEGLHPTAKSFRPPCGAPYDAFWPVLNAANDWGHDYEAQRTGLRASGIPGLWPQDVAAQRGWGPIADRTQEHLGSADVGQIAMRRRLLQAAHNLRNSGSVPPGVENPGAYMLHPAQILLPNEREASWREEIEPLISGPYVDEQRPVALL